MKGFKKKELLKILFLPVIGQVATTQIVNSSPDVTEISGMFVFGVCKRIIINWQNSYCKIVKYLMQIIFSIVWLRKINKNTQQIY